jgi:tetratricopeptide (TPR) repeat protein
MQAYTGHTENAVTAARRAADLNPLSANVYADVVWTLIWAGHPDEAADTLRHAEQLGISKSLAAYLEGRIALAHHDPAAAQRACAAGDDWKKNYCLAIADHLLGQQPAAEAELATLRTKMGDNAAYQYADIYAQWGRPPEAIAALETAYRLHDTGLMEIEVDPLLDPIRTSPDFQAILHRLDFPS